MRKLIALLFILCLFGCNSDKCVGKNFCEMPEECRVKDCSLGRLEIKLSLGTVVTVYKCTKSEGYIMMRNLNPDAVRFIKDIWDEFDDLYVYDRCEGVNGIAFKYLKLE